MKYVPDKRMDIGDIKQLMDKNEGNVDSKEDKQNEQMDINLNTEE